MPSKSQYFHIMKKWQGYFIFFFTLHIVLMFIKYLHTQHDFSIQGSEYQIRVVNGFTNNSSVPLVIWCTTQDGDIGGRALQEGDDYTWYTRLTLWTWAPTPTYSCTIKWDTTRKTFEAFLPHRDRVRCGSRKKCLWLVKEDGVYFSDDESDWVKDYLWIQ
ncbi:S-protein homolog 29-like [Bidens hawaiensis]|uniref:S-protein homolog 29-like n=1 Tax=Bidens hawaiensis TaxID=980011 RepID=UPI004049052A